MKGNHNVKQSKKNRSFKETTVEMKMMKSLMLFFVLLLNSTFTSSSTSTITVEDGIVLINHTFYNFINMPEEEVKEEIRKVYPDIRFEVVSEKLENHVVVGVCVMEVRDGKVRDDPTYIGTNGIVKDWSAYIGRPYTEVMQEIKLLPGMSDLRFVIKHDGHTIYANNEINGSVMGLKVDKDGLVLQQ